MNCPEILFFFLGGGVFFQKSCFYLCLFVLWGGTSSPFHWAFHERNLGLSAFLGSLFGVGLKGEPNNFAGGPYKKYRPRVKK